MSSSPFSTRPRDKQDFANAIAGALKAGSSEKLRAFVLNELFGYSGALSHLQRDLATTFTAYFAKHASKATPEIGSDELIDFQKRINKILDSGLHPADRIAEAYAAFKKMRETHDLKFYDPKISKAMDAALLQMTIQDAARKPLLATIILGHSVNAYMASHIKEVRYEDGDRTRTAKARQNGSLHHAFAGMDETAQALFSPINASMRELLCTDMDVKAMTAALLDRIKTDSKRQDDRHLAIGTRTPTKRGSTLRGLRHPGVRPSHDKIVPSLLKSGQEEDLAAILQTVSSKFHNTWVARKAAKSMVELARVLKPKNVWGLYKRLDELQQESSIGAIARHILEITKQEGVGLNAKAIEAIRNGDVALAVAHTKPGEMELIVNEATSSEDRLLFEGLCKLSGKDAPNADVISMMPIEFKMQGLAIRIVQAGHDQSVSVDHVREKRKQRSM